MTMKKRALLVLTSHTELGTTGRGTGFYYDEMATPYWALVDAGFDVEIASVAGDVAPPAPKTVVDASERPPMVSRFMDDEDAMSILSSTQKASDGRRTNRQRYACELLYKCGDRADWPQWN